MAYRMELRAAGVRVVASATVIGVLGAIALSACGSDRQDESTGRAESALEAGADGAASACRHVELVATRTSAGNVDADVHLDPPMTFALPATVLVTDGSGNHAVLFTYALGAKQVSCRYHGAHQAHDGFVF